MPGRQNDEDIELKVSYMVKRSQGKSALGATNFKKRVFVLTSSRLSYFDGTVEVCGGRGEENGIRKKKRRLCVCVCVRVCVGGIAAVTRKPMRP